jgi:2-phospho-L-lactate guanylyltransferase
MEQRARITGAMTRRVVNVALASGIGDAIVVVSRDRNLLPALQLDMPGITLAYQPATSMGLNAAIDLGRHFGVEHEVDRLVTISADLPLLNVADLLALADSTTDVVVAPDRSGMGTNALVLTGDRALARFRVHFGHGSRDLHVAEALKRHLSVSERAIDGIAFDLDTPEDWAGLPETSRGTLLDFHIQPDHGALARPAVFAQSHVEHA